MKHSPKAAPMSRSSVIDRPAMIIRVGMAFLLMGGFCAEALGDTAPKPRAHPSRSADDGDDATGSVTLAKPIVEAAVSAESLARGIAASLSPASAASLADTIKLVDSGQVGRAMTIASQMSDPASRHMIEWLVAQSGSPDVSVQLITRIAGELPDWPGQALMRRRAEQALQRMNADPQEIIAVFAKTSPGSDEGLILLAGALMATGRTNDAAALIRPRWRKDSFSAANEAAILSQFGKLLTPADHKARMDKFFYDDDAAEGLAISKNLDRDMQALAQARAAVINKSANAGQLLARVPARLHRDPGYIYSSAQYLRRQERYKEAAAMILTAPRDPAALVDPDAWWVERRMISREMLDIGDPRTAYRIVTMHGGESSPNQADAEFHAGWYALRFLNDPATARKHFEAIEAASSMPLSQSRAQYWLGRSAEALGDRNGAIAQYRLAAAYSTTLYGQLAAAKLGIKQISLKGPGTPGAATRRTFDSREMVQAIRYFSAAGYPDRARAFYMQLAEQLSDPAEVALLAEMAERSGDHQLALQIGKKAYLRGLPVDTLAFPVAAIPRSMKTNAVERSVVFAVARQESAFNPGAVSAAGARGLLQLMPATAKMVAKSAGVPYSLQRLTSDPGYNAQLGAVHLGDLVDDFNGSYIMTFAAYNAGKSRVMQWVAQYGDPRDPHVDAVDWIERIPFSETRNYVQRCTENLQVYRARLGEPALVIDRDLHRGGPA